jgi:hypothetical protein
VNTRSPSIIHSTRHIGLLVFLTTSHSWTTRKHFELLIGLFHYCIQKKKCLNWMEKVEVGMTKYWWITKKPDIKVKKGVISQVNSVPRRCFPTNLGQFSGKLISNDFIDLQWYILDLNLADIIDCQIVMLYLLKINRKFERNFQLTHRRLKQTNSIFSQKKRPCHVHANPLRIHQQFTAHNSPRKNKNFSR